MPVMTRIITDESGSTRNEAPMFRSPDVIHVNTVCSIARSGAPRIVSTAETETAKAASIARQATPPEMDFGSRFPRKALTRNPASGSSGISASTAAAVPSPLQAGERLGVQRLPMAEQRDDDGKAHRRFGGSYGHHEEDDHLPVHRGKLPAGSDEGQVHGVQHDLDRQQDRDHV